MSIDWAAFTPYSALIGGALIGLASVLLIRRGYINCLRFFLQYKSPLMFPC